MGKRSRGRFGYMSQWPQQSACLQSHMVRCFIIVERDRLRAACHSSAWRTVAEVCLLVLFRARPAVCKHVVPYCLKEASGGSHAVPSEEGRKLRVAVIGGGPAGASTADALAQAPQGTRTADVQYCS